MSLLEQYESYLSDVQGLAAYAAYRKWVYSGNDEVVSAFNRYLRPHLQSSKTEPSLLDLGGGDCRRSLSFKRSIQDLCNGWCSLTVVDRSRILLRSARQSSGLALVCADIASFRSKKRFDFVVACHSLFTVDPLAFLGTLDFALSSSGLGILISNSTSGLVAELKRFVDTRIWGPGSRRYEIADHLAVIGRSFRVQRVDYQVDWRIAAESKKEFSTALLVWLGLGLQHRLKQDEVAAFHSLVEEHAVSHGGVLHFTDIESFAVISRD